jgi:peptidoglycan biosynthesis protein MviN/MurJ (putative lipid II flippase)
LLPFEIVSMPGVKQAVIRFGSLTMVSRVTGFVRNMVLAGALGRTGLADSYLLANTIPNILYENVVGGVATALLLPRLVESQKRFGTQSREAWGVASQLLWGITLFLVVLAVVGMLLAGPIVEAMTAYGGVGRQADREAAVRFFEIFAWQIPFYGLNAVLMAILNSHDRFSLTAAAPILNNVMAAGAIAGYGLGWWGVDGLALGTTAGVAAMVLGPCWAKLARGTDLPDQPGGHNDSQQFPIYGRRRNHNFHLLLSANHDSVWHPRGAHCNCALSTDGAGLREWGHSGAWPNCEDGHGCYGGRCPSSEYWSVSVG